jgi:phosphoglycerol transferase MdoB-like AlkP superfamily enzyme
MRTGSASTNAHRREAASAGFAYLCRAQAKPLIILAACCALAATSYSQRILAFLQQFASIYSFCFLALLFALLLPARIVLLSILFAVGALKALSFVNELKIAAVSLPVTFDDVTMGVADPTVVVNAAGMRGDLHGIASIALGVLLFAVVSSVFYKRGGYSFLGRPKVARARAETRMRFSSGVLTTVALLAVFIAARTCLATYGKFVHANLNGNESKLQEELWLPSSQVNLSRELGVLEYVAFSFAANEVTRVSLDDRPGPVPAVEELRRTAAMFVNRSVDPLKGLLPNIVFFHAESTFDPGIAFKLAAPFALPLWSKQSETRILGPLRVNVIGGGSWVTEFEVITGVDSRIFGYQGYYTHYSIAPKVKNSFAAYLARKGYTTATFYPVEGSFYNAAKAFKFYGFKEFTDGPALGLPLDWGDLVDRNIVKAVIDHGAFKSAGPFFYFISTSQNHGPHPCRSFEREEQFLTTFAAKVPFEKNCQLNEYLKRAISTSGGFELVLQQLRQIERTTGRPFVLLVYGDHQPWSFTEGVYSVPGGTAGREGYNNFTDVRTSADGYQTFFHLLASEKMVIRDRFTKPPPAWLLPSLMSAFVADSYDDLYLPINFLAFANCGSDIRAGHCKRYGDIVRSAKHALFTEPSLRASAPGGRPTRSPRLVQ